MPGYSGQIHHKPKDPHLRKWMAFIDGENFTIRTQDKANSRNIELKENDCYVRDTFFWIPNVKGGAEILQNIQDDLRLQDSSVRSYYYTSMAGDNDAIQNMKIKIRNCGFSPEVFKKNKKSDKAKGVDIALTIGMLSHAYMNNYDVAVLYSGDGDYVPVVEEVKRTGKSVFVCGYEGSGLSNDLRLASDEFIDLCSIFDTMMAHHSTYNKRL